MPLYEYQCSGCGKSFEKMQPVSKAEERETCPFCGKAGAERRWSVFASGHGPASGATASQAGCGGGGGFT